MNETDKALYNATGIASCIIGILNSSYAGIMIYDSYHEGKIFLGRFPEGPGAIFVLIWIPLLFLIIPAIGNGIGLILGLIGLFQTDGKRIFAILGLIINASIVIFLISCLIHFLQNF